MPSRNTIQRKLVFEAVCRLANHATATEIFEAVSSAHPTISRATVYRNLNILAQEKKILRVAVPNGADRFDCLTTAHYHAKCEKCGAIFDLHLHSLAASIASAAKEISFQIHGADIMLHGLCAKCQKKNTPNE